MLKDDVLRYLKHDGPVQGDLDEKIDSYLADLTSQKAKYHYGIFELEGLKVKGTTLTFKGQSIKPFLSQSSHVVLFACTLGYGVDQKINKLKYESGYDMLIYDACSSAAVDYFLDQMMTGIKGYFMTPRYSPGYGDLPLEHQRDIISILKSDKQLGLTVNASHLLLPMKSVTGCIGLSQSEMHIAYDICDDCFLRHQCDQKSCKRGRDV